MLHIHRPVSPTLFSPTFPTLFPIQPQFPTAGSSVPRPHALMCKPSSRLIESCNRVLEVVDN